jgi:hypothetical protein
VFSFCTPQRHNVRDRRPSRAAHPACWPIGTTELAMSTISKRSDLGKFFYIEAKRTLLVPELVKIKAKRTLLILNLRKIEVKRILFIPQIGQIEARELCLFQK